MAAVDLANEPADSEFEHATSGRRYRIYRQGNELRQRESLTGIKDSDDVVLADFAVKYVVGSGHFSRTYLSEIEGFTVEAPATWFADQQKWDMSPGYDRPFPDGFERAMTENCLYCHAGRIEAVDGTLHKFKVHELAIGCERCHGPGSLHIARWEAHAQSDPAKSHVTEKTTDLTIVNPANLPRPLAEAICQQCHLTSEAQVTARGRKLNEFRPGLPLEDFFMSYRATGPDEAMKVVGHFDQMVLSRCYQKSNTMTCLTCHNPHGTPKPEEKEAYFRSVCLNCHKSEDCRVNSDVRGTQSAENNCVKCHMPAAATEIVHLAFTHHRIGIHDEEPPRQRHPEATTTKLEPWHGHSRLNKIDEQRSLGLAYFDRGYDPGPHSKNCFEQSARLLENVSARGPREGNVASALALILSLSHNHKAVPYATQALEDPDLQAAPRIRALYLLATDHYTQGRPERAVELIAELTRLRRSSADWALLGFCEQSLGKPEAAILAFEKAVAINPKLLPIHRELVRLYEARGESDKATRQRHIGERLLKIAKGVPAAG